MVNIKQESTKGSRSSKFLKDFGVYTIGNLGSKLITFLMVPLYTYCLKQPADYGYYDVCLTLCFLLVPVVTLQMRDGAFRFLIGNDDERKRAAIITFACRTLTATAVATIAVAAAISLFYPIKYLAYTIMLLLVMAANEVMAQISRGLGNNRVFVANGIIQSFGIMALSVILVAMLGMGVRGIFIANIVARVISTCYIEWRMRIVSHYMRRHIKLKAIGRDMLRYSLPLMPVTLCWWLTTSSDRFFIMHFLDLHANGIYAVVLRFSSIIQTLSVIFYQTWQETAIVQYTSSDRDSFFSKILNGYVFMLVALLIAYTFMVKICYGWLVGPEYQSGIDYVYPLGVSTVCYAIAAYFELPYQCAKDTKRAIPSVVLTALINVAFNCLLVPIFGIYGIIATSIISYCTLIAYRWFDTRRYCKLNLYPSTLIPLGLMIACGLVFNHIDALWANAALMVALLVVVAIATPSFIKSEVRQKTNSAISRVMRK